MKYVIVVMECYEDPILVEGIFDTEEEAYAYGYEDEIDFRVVPFNLLDNK